MTSTDPHTIRCALAALVATTMLAACGPRDATNGVPTAQVPPASQGTVPPPPGDSTPKAADSHAREAVESNEKPAGGSSQSHVGTAASGSPPYTVGGAPEGNQSPSQGQGSNEPAKK